MELKMQKKQLDFQTSEGGRVVWLVSPLKNGVPILDLLELWSTQGVWETDPWNHPFQGIAASGREAKPRPPRGNSAWSASPDVFCQWSPVSPWGFPAQMVRKATRVESTWDSSWVHRSTELICKTVNWLKLFNWLKLDERFEGWTQKCWMNNSWTKHKTSELIYNILQQKYSPKLKLRPRAHLSSFRVTVFSWLEITRAIFTLEASSLVLIPGSIFNNFTASVICSRVQETGTVRSLFSIIKVEKKGWVAQKMQTWEWRSIYFTFFFWDAELFGFC